MENEIIINGVTYVKKEDNQNKQSKRGNGYRFIDTDGDILHDSFIPVDKYEQFCYPTETEAIKARDKQLALYRIKTYAEEKRGEFVPDWDNHSQQKFSILYNIVEHEYTINNNQVFQISLQLFLGKEEHCEEIIEKFKDDLDILFDRKGKQ